ncbi:hypothetical protein JRO89_XS02G0150900 [Xanthoceras sorbifolium]|uniref:RING-type E3 ubiquitin transferase n=1 Tax=Xanthoceras sorbifolium TaxID=99658 RepID=A0ABQ8IFW3_9ROSI|nr:hypothetical protein JRO89_XS02G0150900 [Xanthoceras sorbifolium]
MGLQFHHRNLIKDSIKEATEFCTQVCDSSDDSDVCISPCLELCPGNCKYLTPPPTPPSPHHSSQPRKILIISVTVLATALLALACYAIYVKFYLGWYSSRRRSRSEPSTINQNRDDFVDEDHGPMVDHHIWYIQTVGLQPSVISSITVCKYKKGDGLVEGTECSVCLNEFQEDETLRLLPKCNHAFHIPCSGIESGDTRIDVSDENGESETRLGVEVFEEEMVKVVRCENSGEMDDEMQPMRRSVSLDFLSASKISEALVNSNNQLTEETDSSIRRSLSCSGK